MLRYWAAPSTGLPDSSPLQAMNLNVLLGLYPFLSNNLKASKTEINPPPSSLAPVCDPVSQVSICPPARIIWSGYVLPIISKIRLLELEFGTYLFLRTRWTFIVSPLFCILANISASSTVIAAHGIFLTSLSYSM